MKTVDGWFCPDLLSGPGKYARRAREDVPLALEHCKQRRVAIQAGGHVGTWPIFLSHHFETVYTFEPAPENFDCLVRNIAAHARDPASVYAARGALGDKRGPIELYISGKSTGQHRVRHGADGIIAGTIPTYRIDDLQLPVVDAIFLDLEGFEGHAVRGAAQTIALHRPVVMAENNSRAREQGFRPDALEKFFAKLGYRKTADVHEDLIFVPR